MKFLRWVTIACFLMGAGGLASSCSNGSGQLGSETNWLDPCGPSSVCVKGSCLCGICTDACTGNAACGGNPSAICVTKGNEPYDALCNGEPSAPAGVCAATCRTSADCAPASRCVASVCAPSAVDASAGGSGGGGQQGGTGNSGAGGAVIGGSGGTSSSTSGGAGGSGGNPNAGGNATGGRASGGTSTDGSVGGADSAAGGRTTGPPDSSTDGALADSPVGSATWDPSPATSAACAPNCNAAQCGTTCAQGAPCDTGCCSANTISIETVASVTNAPGSATALAVDSSGTIHYALNSAYIFYTEKGPSGWPTESNVDPGAWTGDYEKAYSPHLAMGKRGSSDLVYLTYYMYSQTLPERGRFGVKSGTTWTFEDLPARPVSLAADATGTAIVLTKNGILRRNAVNGWDTISLPTAPVGPPSDLAVDSTGALFLASVDTAGVHVSRRAPTGSWASEIASTNSSATSLRIAVAAGTVHVSYEMPDLHYARRVGTAWVDHVVQVAAAGQQILEHAMAIDGCGSPHFDVWTGTDFKTHYTRWTPNGWRTHTFAQGCLFGDGLGIVVTSTAVLMSYFNCPYLLATIPLK